MLEGSYRVIGESNDRWKQGERFFAPGGLEALVRIVLYLAGGSTAAYFVRHWFWPSS